MENTERDGRKISLERAEELKAYHEENPNIPKGTDTTMVSSYEEQKAKLLSILNGDEKDWNDWQWQVKNRIDNVDELAKILVLSEEDKEEIRICGEVNRIAITPYYLALIDPENPLDPIRRLCVPDSLERNVRGEDDPMAEEFTNPAGVITRRYPDRLIINVTNACAMYCRHCQRRRRIGGIDKDATREQLEESFEYIRSNPEVREVLVTGGDALMLEDEQLEYIFSSLRSIPTIEVIRIGSRVLVTLPMRINDSFLAMIKKYHPLYLNTHFNHPREVTPEAVAACTRLSDAGLPLGNQMVLLRGVNDDKHIVHLLNREILKARVRPYYIFHAKNVAGTTHLGASIDEGLAIMEYLRGRTSGMMIPTYAVNAPNGLGKIPMLPEYVVEKTAKKVILRTWEGKLVEYPI
jgi:lysine 2,3-aminomutase